MEAEEYVALTNNKLAQFNEIHVYSMGKCLYRVDGSWRNLRKCA